MDDLVCAPQGDPTEQQRVSERISRSLKEISPFLPGEVKDSISLNKALDREGYSATVKETLR